MLTLFNLILTEQPCSITSPLINIETIEGATMSLVLVLSKPRAVTWLKGSKQIAPDDKRIVASVSETGFEHTLKISEVSLDENCAFVAEVNDNEYGILKSESNVTVKGMVLLVKL